MTFGIGHTEIAILAHLGIGTFLLTDDHHGFSVELGKSSDHSFIILHVPVPEEFDKIVGHFLDILHCVGPIGMAAQLYLLPGGEVGRNVAPAFSYLVV